MAQTTVKGFYRIRARPPKIIDFDPFYVWMVTWIYFVDSFFKIEKSKKIFYQYWHQRVPPLKKKIKNFKNNVFFAKNHTFSLWICVVHVLWYITLIYRSRATTGRSRLLAAPLRFQAKNCFLFASYVVIWWPKMQFLNCGRGL